MDAVDALTGAWRRGPGLVKLQDEIDRVRRETGQLVVAYVDIDGLKAINDTQGHHAGDLWLKHVVGVLREHFRSSELIVRLGGDEFLCAATGASVWDVQHRFAKLASELSASADGGSITVGLAELTLSDSAADLIERADNDLLAARGTGRLATKRRKTRPTLAVSTRNGLLLASTPTPRNEPEEPS